MDISELNSIAFLKALISIEGIGPQKIISLKNKFKTFEKIFNSSLPSLLEVDGINLNLAKKIHLKKNEIEEIRSLFQKELIQLEKEKAQLITFWDPEYPPLLKEIYYPPIIIYAKGNVEIISPKSIAIVGTRNPTHYGKAAAEKFSSELTQNDLTIVSGLARGIDSIAHTSCLRTNGNTIAIIGCGLDIVYPPENKKLMQEIAEKGLIISEFTLGTKPDATNFPRRNRIISGLSRGVLVIESRVNGGAMQTAAYALDQGREVFALPGNINSIQSDGCNTLIQEGRAKLIKNVDDILDEFNFDSKEIFKSKIALVELNLFEEKIIGIISEKPLQIDEIANLTGYPTSDCLVHLLTLELKGLVRQLPGKQFEAC